MRLHYYIYYRIAPEALAEAVSRIAAMQCALRLAGGVRGRCLARADDPATLMEIYETVTDPEAFEAALARLVEQHGLAALLAPGERRHVERFAECA
jgi:hypothetical protein